MNYHSLKNASKVKTWKGIFWRFPVCLLYCLSVLALQFSSGFKILTKTFSFLSCSSTLSVTHHLAGQKAPFPSSNVISLLYRHSKYHAPSAVPNRTANEPRNGGWHTHGSRYRCIRWTCIENFLKVAVRAQNNWPKVRWFLKYATVLSHHGAMSRFPCWKDWDWLWLQIGDFFQTSGRSWTRLLQVLQERDQNVCPREGFSASWRKVKRLNKEEGTRASAEQSSCMTLKCCSPNSHISVQLSQKRHNFLLLK